MKRTILEETAKLSAIYFLAFLVLSAVIWTVLTVIHKVLNKHD